MDTKKRCQSCGMPLGDENYGTEFDGVTTSEVYCKMCYERGTFTRPDLTLEEMIALSIHNMSEDLRMPPDQAATLARTVIPKLSRWANS
jgi:hypothetical protein